MRFFLDKNIPKSVIAVLQNESHLAEHARTIFPQETTDEKIADYAKNNNAILITKDLEIGSLIIYPKGSHYGIIIIRFPYYFTANQIASNFGQFLKRVNHEELKGHITILELNRYRMRKL